MKKVTKGLLTTGVIALVIGACGDTVEVVVPEVPPPPPITFPPPPPPPPPLPPPPPPPPPVNQAPTAVGSIPAAQVAVGATSTFDAAGYFSDPDGDELTYSAGSSNEGAATVSMEGSNATITGVADGTAVVTITARDPDGAAAAQGFSVTSGKGNATNSAPMAVGSIAARTLDVGGTATVDVAGFFSDPDGDELTFAATSSNDAVAAVANEGSSVTITAVAAGAAVATITATDPDGAAAAQEVSITVNEAGGNSPPTAVGTIPAHSVNIGGTATLDVAGYFSDADGDELTYSGASSSPEVATISMEGSAATITGVAVGGAVVTVTASDGSASGSQGFNVSVSDPSGKAATVAIFGLRSVTDRSTAVDPTDVSGDVTVLLDVQPNDDTIAGISLTLGEEVIHCRGTSSDQGGFIAAASGQLEVECLFKTASIMGECAGAQLPPLYANGDHILGARVTTADGETREAIVTQPITLKNSGFVMVEHSAGSASAVKTGVTYYGGPVDEDDDSNQNTFHACPASYDGTTVGELSLTTMLTGPDAAAIDTTVADSTRGATLKLTKEKGAFTWNVVPASNGGVEDRAGKDEHWVINSGDIKDDGDLLVTSKFRGDEEARVGPLHFDFKVPTWTHDPDEDEPQEILVTYGATAASTNQSVGNTYYNSGALSVRGLTDGGVGGAGAIIAVGDCGIVANSDSLKSTAFMPAAGLEAISNMAELPEEDATKDFADDKGLSCYVGEVTAIADELGNEATLPGIPISTINYFGVDKGRPVVTDVEPDSRMVLKRNAFLAFEAEDPDLATGEAGSGYWATLWFVGTKYIGAFSNTTKLKSISQARLGLTKDGAYRVTAWAQDNATPGNRTTVGYSFVRDGLAPTFAVSKSQSNIGNTQATTVIVSVGGTISDANGIEAAELSVRSPVEGVCPAGDDDELNLPARRVTGNKRDLSDDGSSSITFDETFTVKAPSAGDISGTEPFVSENLCFYLYVEDVATDREGEGPGNWKEYDVGSFSVNWSNPGPVHDLGAAHWVGSAQGAAITAEAPLMVTEGDEDGSQFVLTLSSGISVSVMTVTFSGPPTVTFSPPSIVIDSVHKRVSVPVTVTARHDRNATSEKSVITASASGGGPNYNGATTTIPVTAADDDYTMSVVIRDISGNRYNGVTEKTPFDDAAAVARWVNIVIKAPEGGILNEGMITLPDGDDYTFREPGFLSNVLQPYSGDEMELTMVQLGAFSSSAPGTTEADVWLIANDDLEEEEAEFVQIGADQIGEGARTDPVMIRIDDADPDVTFSIGNVSEGADGVTMTVTATAAGPMPGIFDLPANRWALVDEGGALATAGYAFTASGTLTIDRNQTSGTVTVTVTTPEDEDTDNEMLKIGLTTEQSVELKDAANLKASVGILEITVEDNDEENGGG